MKFKEIIWTSLAGVILACGGSETSETSLKMNVKFVDPESENLHSQAVFPEGVNVVYIDVCEIPEADTMAPDTCLGPVDILRDSGQTSYTFTGLAAGKSYNVEIWTKNSEGIRTYWGGTTVTLREGENTVNVVAVRLPWRSAGEYIQLKPPLSSCSVFYDLTTDTYDFSFDSKFFSGAGFPLEAKNLIVYSPTGNFNVISEGTDNGTTYTDLQLIPIYDDGLHYDGRANDGRWNIRLRYTAGGGGIPVGLVTYKVRDPLGGNFYSYEYCKAYPIIYVSDRLSNSARANAGGDDIWDANANEDVILEHDLTGGDYAVFVFFESSSNPINFDSLSGSDDVFRQLVFGVAARSPYGNYSITTSTVTIPGTDVASWLDFTDPRAYGFDQMRFVIVDETNGQWQVSNPIRFSF